MNNETINPNENKDIINDVPKPGIIDSVPGNQDEESNNESNKIITEVPGIAEEMGKVAIKSKNTESTRFEFDDDQENTDESSVNEQRTRVHKVDQ